MSARTPTDAFAGYVALALRAVLGFLILFDLLQGNLFNSAFYGGIWLVVFALFLFGRAHERYAYADAIMLAFFILAWNAPAIGIHMESSVFGVDKLFHTVGGALLACVGLLIAREWVPDARARTFVAVIFAMALGSGWEVFEWVFHLLHPNLMQTTYADSMLDIVADTVGAILVVISWYSMRE